MAPADVGRVSQAAHYLQGLAYDLFGSPGTALVLGAVRQCRQVTFCFCCPNYFHASIFCFIRSNTPSCRLTCPDMTSASARDKDFLLSSFV